MGAQKNGDARRQALAFEKYLRLHPWAMGSFFTGIHIRRGAKSSVETIESTLDKLAKKSGLERCVDDAPKIDRTVIIRAADGPWIHVYDEATEDQDSDKLDALGEAFSESTQSSVVSVLVHDSDVLLLGLFEKGKKVDQYDSHPEYFTGLEPSKKARERAAGKPKFWKHLLAAGVLPEKLAEIWREEKLFAEQTLAQVAQCLDCPVGRLSVGFNYLEKDKIPGSELRVLRYALKKRPAHERVADGPPRFTSNISTEFAAVTPRHELAVGDELRIGITCTNAGGVGEGISIRIWGDALEKGLVEITALELLIGNPLQGSKHQHLVPTVIADSRGKVWKADAVTPIPAGIRGGLASLTGDVDWRAIQQVMFQAQVHVNVVGIVKAPGQGRLHAALFPLHGAEEQAYVGRNDLAIDPPLYRPLRADSTDPGDGGSIMLRPLSQREKLVAMVVYGVDQAKASKHAMHAFERMLAVCPSVERFESAIFYAQESRRPATGRLKTKNLAKEKRWADIIAAAQKERQVTLEPVFDPDKDDAPDASGFGFAFGRAMEASFTRKGKETAALLLWVHVDGLADTWVQSIRATIRAIIEDAMTNLGGLQGFLTRWGLANSTLDMTLYEQAVGIQGSESMLRAWSERYLRAIGNDTLWLGPELRKHIDQSTEDGLAALGHFTDAGRYVCIELVNDDNEGVMRLEKHLAALLPTAEDARVFAQNA